jgi:hypothetical protein
MEKQNITLSLPKSLLRKAKAIASVEEKSLSEFLKESLEERIGRESGYIEAKERQLNIIHKGFDFGTNGHIKHTREELHERE